MNDRIKCLAACMIAMMVFLVGCGGDVSVDNVEKEYPVWELVDISGMELLDAEDDTMKYQVPADTWIPGTNVNDDMVVLLAETYGTEEPVAVNAVVGDHGGTTIDETFMDGVSASINSDLGMSVKSSELRSFNGQTICCMELTVEYTDEVIDNMLKYGAITEEELNNVGGREYFLSMPAYETVSVYMLIGNQRVTCGGPYYNQEQKEAVMSLINIILQTIELK